jgi:hypothetical protein
MPRILGVTKQEIYDTLAACRRDLVAARWFVRRGKYEDGAKLARQAIRKAERFARLVESRCAQPPSAWTTPRRRERRAQHQ